MNFDIARSCQGRVTKADRSCVSSQAAIYYEPNANIAHARGILSGFLRRQGPARHERGGAGVRLLNAIAGSISTRGAA